MSKNRKPQGHPARANRDDTNLEIERLATRLVKLVPTIIRDPRFDPNDVIVAKAAAVGALHLMARLDGKPTPFEIYGMEPFK